MQFPKFKYEFSKFYSVLSHFLADFTLVGIEVPWNNTDEINLSSCIEKGIKIFYLLLLID